jgi:hypothetical protein
MFLLRRYEEAHSRTPPKGEACVKKSTSTDAPSLTKIST